MESRASFFSPVPVQPHNEQENIDRTNEREPNKLTMSSVSNRRSRNRTEETR